MNWTRTMCCCIVMTAAFAMTLTGCTPYKDAKKAPTPPAEAHPTKGPHGGPLAEWGNDDFHIEFKVDTSTKTAIAYVLDGTAKKAPKDDPAKITDMRLIMKDPKIELDLKYDAKRSDEKGIAFVATDEAFAKDAEYKGTVIGKVNGKSFNGDFPLTPD